VNSLISHDEKHLIMTIFLRLDKGSKGELDHHDLREGFLELLNDEYKAELCATKILNRLRRGKIVFSEFLTYCANRFFLIREVNLQKIFEVFDEDGSGEIEIGELRDTLGNSKEVREEVWVELVREANANSEAKLSYEQFGDMIRQLNYSDRESTLDLDNIFTW
jgi:Ca2+-binding EF-hand superfamily protein